MKDRTKRAEDWRDGIAAACERLVHPDVRGSQRDEQARLIGLLLAGPLLAGFLLGQLLWEASLAAMIPSALCLAFVTAWTCVVIVAQTGRSLWVCRLAGLALGLLVGTAIGAGGMLQSPLLVLLAAPAFEGWFMYRSRGGAIAGGWIAFAALALALFLSAGEFMAAQGFAGHLWIVPLAYAATVWLRLPMPDAARHALRPLDAGELARLTGALVVEVNRQGNVETIEGDAGKLLGVRPLALLGPGLFDRMQVTDRVTYLTGIDRACRGEPAVTLRIRLRQAGAGAADHVACRLSLASAGEDCVLIAIHPEDMAEAQGGDVSGQPVVRIGTGAGEGRRQEVPAARPIEIAEQGNAEARRSA